MLEVREEGMHVKITGSSLAVLAWPLAGGRHLLLPAEVTWQHAMRYVGVHAGHISMTISSLAVLAWPSAQTWGFVLPAPASTTTQWKMSQRVGEAGARLHAIAAMGRCERRPRQATLTGRACTIR
jgi:hypothetical protein